MNTLTPLTPLQMEILEIYSTELPEEELKELKIHIARFFANKAIREADMIWEQKQLSQQVNLHNQKKGGICHPFFTIARKCKS